MDNTLEQIQNTIKDAIPDCTAYIFDPNNDGQHFEAIVISASFNDMPIVKQHQLVLTSLKNAFSTNVHALQLKTFTPLDWETEKYKYNL